MKYHQKKGKNIVEIEIVGDNIKYFIQDETSKGTFTIPLASISKDTIEYTEKNNGFKNYAIYMLIVGGVFTFLTFAMKIPTYFFAFLAGSIVMHILYRRSFTYYTIIQTPKKNIYVIKDHQHGAIINELFDARKRFYKELYFHVNADMDPVAVAHSFKWLLEEEIITQQEYDDKINEVHMLKEKEPDKEVN